MAQGTSWQMAIAVPIKNHKFEFGQNFVATLQNSVDSNSQFVQLDPAIYDRPGSLLQYRDQILLGPSSNPDFKGNIEHVPVTGVKEDFIFNTYSKIYLLNKNNINQYEAGDRVSFYGTCLAGGWKVPNKTPYNYNYFFTPQGIQKGSISTHVWATYISNPLLLEGMYDDRSHASGTWIKIRRKNSDHSFLLDLDEVYGNKIQYIIDPVYLENSAYYFNIAMQSGNYSEIISGLLGDYHRGGWRKQYAQRLSIAIDDDTPSTLFFVQDLVKSGIGGIRDRSLLIPYQYYRFGGRIYVESRFTSAKLGTSNYSLFMIVSPHTLHRDIGDAEYLYVNFANAAAHNDAWIEFSAVQLLDTGISNESMPQVGLWFQNNGIIENNAGDLILYVDDLYVEHAGGIKYAHQDGCLDFGRYSVWPEEESLKIEKIEREGTTSLYGKKERYVITCRFFYVSQDFWDQFELLLEWQEKGFLLNLHPYINDLPHSLMGKVHIREYAKDNWDLSLRSFTMEFIEE